MKINRFFAVSAIGVTMWSNFFAGNCSGGTTGGSGTELSPEEWRRNKVKELEKVIGSVGELVQEGYDKATIDQVVQIYNKKHQDIDKAAEEYQNLRFGSLPAHAEERKLLEGKSFSMNALHVVLKRFFYKDYAEKSTYWSGLSKEDKDKVMEAVDLVLDKSHSIESDKALALFIKHHDEYLNSGKKLSDKEDLADYIAKKVGINFVWHN